MGISCFGTRFWHVLTHTHIGGSINGGTQNGLFSMENPIIGWFRGTPISGNLHLFEEWNMENGWSWPSWWYMLYYTFLDGSFIHKRLYTHCQDSHCGIDDHTPHTMVDHGQHLSTRGGTFARNVGPVPPKQGPQLWVGYKSHELTSGWWFGTCRLQTLGLPTANPAYPLTCSNPFVEFKLFTFQNNKP